MGSKDLIEKLKQMNIEVKSHMSVLTDVDVNKVLDKFSPKKEAENKENNNKIIEHEKNLKMRF